MKLLDPISDDSIVLVGPVCTVTFLSGPAYEPLRDVIKSACVIARTVPGSFDKLELTIAAQRAGQFYLLEGVRGERAYAAQVLAAITIVDRFAIVEYRKFGNQMMRGGATNYRSNVEMLHKLLAAQKRAGLSELQTVHLKVLLGLPRSSDLQSFLPMTARDLEEVLDTYAYGDRGRRMFLQSIPKPDVVMRLSLLAESAGLLDL